VSAPEQGAGYLPVARMQGEAVEKLLQPKPLPAAGKESATCSIYLREGSFL
jgi:hypothetical protein